MHENIFNDLNCTLAYKIVVPNVVTVVGNVIEMGVTVVGNESGTEVVFGGAIKSIGGIKSESVVVSLMSDPSVDDVVMIDIVSTDVGVVSFSVVYLMVEVGSSVVYSVVKVGSAVVYSVVDVGFTVTYSVVEFGSTVVYSVVEVGSDVVYSLVEIGSAVVNSVVEV